MSVLWMRTAAVALLTLVISLPMIAASKQKVLLQRWLVWLVLFALFGATSFIYVTSAWKFPSVLLVLAISIGMFVEFIRLPAVRKWWWLPFGIVWIFGLPSIWMDANPDRIFALFLLVAVFDIGGWIGGHSPLKRGVLARQLAPKISPNKTWAGVVGSVVIVALLNIPVGLLNLWQLLALCLLATGGDLLESWVKRKAGVKDAGRILPGFGGLMDRFDSLVFAGLLLVLL